MAKNSQPILARDLRKTLYTLFLLCFVHFLGQAQPDFNFNEINKVDETGMKQNFWVEYEIDTLIEPWSAILTDTSGIDTTINYYIYHTGYYLNNLKDSTWHFYDTKSETKGKNLIYGNLLFEATYESDSLKGTFRTYYLTGKVKSEVYMENDKAIGKINIYFENGELYLTGEMKPDSEFFNGVEYNINGNKVRERKFSYDSVLREWTDIDKLLGKTHK